MTDVMIDLETLNTSPDAVVLTLGAVKFKRSGPAQTLKDMDHFYTRIELQSCLDAGLSISQETKAWWDQQSAEARHEALIHKDRIPLKEALLKFRDWFGDSRYIWSHGATFDCVILEQAYKACNLPTPWKFWSARDTRTLFDLAGVKIKDFPISVAHHALHDAFRQVLATKASIEKLGLYKTKK